MMNILIRTELGGHFGLGHTTRMRALAQALVARGAEVAFVTATPALRAFVAPLPCHDVTAWGLRADVCVIDTRGDVAHSILPGARMVRVDLPDADPRTTHLLVGPCAHWDAATVAQLQAQFGERFLYGWDYVLLDPAVAAQEPIPYAERVDGPIVFCAGGSDPAGVLRRMYEWAAYCDVDVPCVFVYGRDWSDVPVTSDGHAARSNLWWEPFERRWLRSAALVVGLLGVTIYECLWWETPCLVFARDAADVPCLDVLEGASGDAVLPVGEFCRTTPQRLCRCVERWWELEAWRRHGSGMCQSLLDGRGAARIAEAIVALR